MVLWGWGLFAALIAWVSWLFRPEADPGAVAHGFGLAGVVPATLLLATVLVVVGTTRLLAQRAHVPGAARAADMHSLATLSPTCAP